ncbi:ArdC family protein [Cerasicoccus arenae]|nr:zincin-like metallopeptidase domain-containing protein [Cerasicoccus arenae]MBK1857788.1 DUF1738 domain-containing protein [Cerasicoccus arenae]
MKQTPYEKITERILKLLEEGVCPWKRPWSHGNSLPQNFVGGNVYRGINLFLLNAMAFESPYFLTFKQAKDLGGAVRKGEKGLPVVYWGQKLVEEATDSEEDGKKIRFLKCYTVFNARQIEDVEFPTLEEREAITFSPIEAAETILAGWLDAPKIDHGFKKAAWNPGNDTIIMPSRNQFESPDEYYSTLFHELGHATGHPKRLDRNMTGGGFGSEAYGREELVAEMTSAFLCAECGIDNSVIENQAAYLDGWIRTIKKDARLVVIAAAQASRAAGMILGRSDQEA